MGQQIKEKLMAGIWVDEDNNLHFWAADLCRAFGWPNDEKHRAVVEMMVRELCAKHFPGTVVVYDQ